MWAAGYFPFLFLILELIPQPGVSQGGYNWKQCQDCKHILKEADVTERFSQILVKRAKYTPCPNNIVRFQLPRGVFCGNRIESWVDKVMGCIDQGRLPCLEPSENQNDFSKGSNDRLPSTIQETTASATKAGPSPGQSIQTWEKGTQKELSHQNNGGQHGVSQGGNNWKLCQDCKKMLKETHVTEHIYQFLVKNAKYSSCPNNIIRFELPRGTFCGERGEPWVGKVTERIDQGVSQEEEHKKLCQDCKNLLKDSDVTEPFYQILIKNSKYTSCPNNIFRFELLGETFCGSLAETWVDKVTGCIIKGRLPCLKLF